MSIQTKYVRVLHWDYWWSVYQLMKENEPQCVELSLTDDMEGEKHFFHFGFLQFTCPAKSD